MLSFSEWDKEYYSIDESIEDNVKNWLSRTFGGGIKKIDSILADLVYLEKKYVGEWEKAQRTIYDLKKQIDSEDISAPEKKDFRNKIRNLQSELEILNRKKEKEIDLYNLRAKSVVEGKERLKKYWELKKAEAEVEVLNNLYNVAKTLPDSSVSDSIYKKFLTSKETYKKKEEGMEEITKRINQESSVPEAEDLIYMGRSGFKEEMGKYSKEQLKTIKKLLVDAKNDSLNNLRYLKRRKSQALEDTSSSERDKVLQFFNPKIYQVGERIDRIREKIDLINE